MKRAVLTNISFNFLIRAFSYLFSFLTILYVTRVLLPEAFGRISFVSSFTGYFIMFAELGMPIYGMRMCAEKRNDREELDRAFSELWSISVVLAAASAIAFSAAILSVPRLRENSTLFIVYGSAIFFNMAGCEWLYKGLEKFRFLAGVSFVCKAVSFVCILLFVRSEQQIVLYAILSVLAAYGSSIICFTALRRHVNISFSLHLNRAHFKPLMVFFMMALAVSIYSSLDLTMLGFMRTEYDTGLYAIAAKAKTVLAITGGIVWNSMLPLATKLWKDGNRRRFEILSAKAVAGVCGVQTAAAVIGIVFAKYIILFAAGSRYIGAVPSLRILLLSLLPVGASNILGGMVLIPAGKEKRLLQAEAAGAVFNFFSNLALIPVLSIVGAALTTVISEVIVWALCVYFIRRDLQMDLGAGVIGKVCKKIRSVLRMTAAKARSRTRGSRLAYYCPCCGTYLKRFVEGEFRSRPDIYDPARYEGTDQQVVCPVCRSLPRHRILVSWMDENVTWIRNKRVLHFAQERSVKMWMDRNHIAYTTADLYDPADLQIDIEDTGLADDSCDFIICNHVLEHVSDHKKALRELHRILHPDGKLIVSFPIYPAQPGICEDRNVRSEAERIRRFGQRDHLRIFGKDSPDMLKDMGFRVTAIRGEDYADRKIKPITGPADYDCNVLWCLEKRERERRQNEHDMGMVNER